MNASLIAWLGVAAFMLASCGGCEEAAPPQGHVPPKDAGPPLRLTPEEHKAVDLAQAFLANKGMDWGKPFRFEPQRGVPETLVGKGEDTYLLFYRTPDDEMKLLGDRSIFVNLRTGAVALQPRK
jgi:hypothetical protein